MAITVASSFDQTAAVPLDSRIVVADLTARDAMASGIRYEGLIVYVTADAKNYQLIGGITNGDWTELQGAGGGGINYILAPDGTDLTGWSAYADAAASSPVDGTGGSPSSTFALSTDSSLVGTENFLWTKSAANRQGEGFSYAFSIDQGYQSKPITVSFMYKVASGTYADGDMTVWIYDVTNAAMIQPSAYTILNASGATVQKCEFQAASNSTSYRLIVHTSSTSASAYSIRFDSISVSPNTYNSGAVVTEPVAYTPTFTGFGTVSVQNFKSWRSGKYLFVDGTFTCGTVTATEARITLGYNGKNANVTTVSTLPTLSQVGAFSIDVNGANAFTVLTEASKNYLTLGNGYVSGASLAKGNGNIVGGTGAIISLFGRFEIEGWGTSQVLSSDTDTRVVSFQAAKSAGSYTTPGALATWTVTNKDSHGSFNATSGVYTISVAGDYWFSGKVSTSLTTTLNLFKNSTIIHTGTNGTSSNGIVLNYLATNCIVGDTFYLSMPDSGTISTNTAPYTTTFAGSRISGPAQIAASEKIIAKYGVSANRSTDSSTPINMDTRIIDTHGAVTTGAGVWKFIAPRAGPYRVSAALEMTTSTGLLSVYKNGVDDSFMGQFGAAVGGGGTTIVQLIAGDYIDFRVNTGSTKTVVGTAGYNVCIESI